MHYRRTNRDSNHKGIVTDLRAAGATVLDLAAVGGGCPDLLVGFKGRNTLMEVKRPGVAGKKRGARQAAINDRQQTFRSEWQGLAFVVTSSAEALAAIGALELAKVHALASDRRLQA